MSRWDTREGFQSICSQLTGISNKWALGIHCVACFPSRSQKPSDDLRTPAMCECPAFKIEDTSDAEPKLGSCDRLALNRNYDPTHHDLLFAFDARSPLLSNLLYLQDEKHLLQRSLHSEQVFRNSHPFRSRHGLPLIRWRALGPDSRLLWTKTNEGDLLDELQGNSQMDKRDPVVMQAITNVIGAQTIDMGCLGPPPGQTQAIYDEIKRLDRARLDEAEDRRKAEVEAQQKKNRLVSLRQALSMAAA
jgi:hypothetical protein